MCGLAGAPFGGIVLQEFDRTTMSLVGEPQVIFRGSGHGMTEAPHLYKHGGLYYLMTAEGGTVYDHQVTMARSERLNGPYQIDPENPILTSANDPNLALQKAGHASLVHTSDGEPYLAFLCGRPLLPRRLCPLGRETALARARWTDDGWLRLEGGGRAPSVTVNAPARVRDRRPPSVGPVEETVTFEPDGLPDAFQTLRLPLEPSWADLVSRPGYLRLTGRESLGSRHRQSLVGRRRQAFRCEAEVALEAAPRSFQHMAGLVCYYDTRNYVYLHVTHDEALGRVVALLQSDAGETRRPNHAPLAVRGDGPVRLRMTLDDDRLRCWVMDADGAWRALGPMFDAGLLSDEYDGLGFTGTFLAMAAQDLAGTGFVADFASFCYREDDGVGTGDAHPPATTSSSV